MKTLSEIKDEVAKEAGMVNWDNLCFVWVGFMKQIEPYMDEVAKRYAAEALRECAKKARVLEDKEISLNLINEMK